MAGKCLIGELNNTASRTKYIGQPTSSLRINVDNANMTISGDVIWTDALGEIASRAYPGDKGARNYAKIQELTSRLNNELAQATKYRSHGTTELKRIAKAVADLQTALDNEISRAQQEENELHAKTTREIDRSIKTDQELFDKIREESSARKKAGMDLINMITETNSTIYSEVERAYSVEEQLRLKIEGVEDSYRLEDSFLQRQISELITRVDQDTVKSVSTDGSLHLYAVTGTYQHTLPVSSEAAAYAVVQRDMHGNILIDDSLAFEERAAVSKKYMQQSINELNSNILGIIQGVEFIDGGGAPI